MCLIKKIYLKSSYLIKKIAIINTYLCVCIKFKNFKNDLLLLTGIKNLLLRVFMGFCSIADLLPKIILK